MPTRVDVDLPVGYDTHRRGRWPVRWTPPRGGMATVVITGTDGFGHLVRAARTVRLPKLT